MFEIIRHISASEFLDQSEAWLSQAEAENNLVLGVARQYQEDRSHSGPQRYWATIHRANRVVGCAFRTPPLRLAITRMPLDAIPLLAENAGDVSGSLPGVGGPIEEAKRFAEVWTDKHKMDWRVRMRMRIHVITQVYFPEKRPNGVLRPPLEGESPLIREWSQRFVEDTGISQTPEELVDHWLASGHFYIWEDEEARCMVAAGRDTPHGKCVNAVYTPPLQRRHGYASVAVATLSHQLLSTGSKFCCLYTDCANPTSNSIYKRIGYLPVRDDVEIDFLPLIDKIQ